MKPNTAHTRGHNFTLQPTDYVIGPASGNPNMCLTWPRASQPTADGIDWQLGTPWAAYTKTCTHPVLFQALCSSILYTRSMSKHFACYEGLYILTVFT